MPTYTPTPARASKARIIDYNARLYAGDVGTETIANE